MSEPVSGSPYIIICSTETDVAVAATISERVAAVSRGASHLVGWMQSYYKHFKPIDAQSISTIQHQLMDWAKGDIELTNEQVEQKIVALLAEFHELEDKY